MSWWQRIHVQYQCFIVLRLVPFVPIHMPSRWCARLFCTVSSVTPTTRPGLDVVLLGYSCDHALVRRTDRTVHVTWSMERSRHSNREEAHNSKPLCKSTEPRCV